MAVESSDSIPLWLLYEHEVDAWRAAQTAAVARWLLLQNFRGEKHRVVLLPDAAGGIAAAVAGLGRRSGELSLWHAAGFVERLPPRRQDDDRQPGGGHGPAHAHHQRTERCFRGACRRERDAEAHHPERPEEHG